MFVACPRATPLQLGPARTGGQKTQPARRRRCPLRSAWAGILRKACRWVAGCDGRAGAGLLGLGRMVPRAQPPHRRMPARREHKKRPETINLKAEPGRCWAYMNLKARARGEGGGFFVLENKIHEKVLCSSRESNPRLLDQKGVFSRKTFLTESNPRHHF